MEIFITGSTGFIGWHLVRRMAQTEHEIFCLARKTSDTSELIDQGAYIVIGEVTDRASLREGMRGCEWVFNLANVHSSWESDKEVYRRVNVLGTCHVMECALEAGVSEQALDEGSEAWITAIRSGATFRVKGTVPRNTDTGMAIGFVGDIPSSIERIIETEW